MNDMFHKVFTISNHLELKTLILDDIEKFEDSSIYTNEDTITKTDWNIPYDVPRDYFKHMGTFIDGDYSEFARYLGGSTKSKFRLHNVWFQQYYNTDIHGTHCHPGSHFTNIYYLELPHQFQKTEFYNPVTASFFTFDVKEGDLLTVPAYYPHRSPKNTSNSRKTVVAFNSCLEV